MHRRAMNDLLGTVLAARKRMTQDSPNAGTLYIDTPDLL
jgi:hypothetical protein